MLRYVIYFLMCSSQACEANTPAPKNRIIAPLTHTHVISFESGSHILGISFFYLKSARIPLFQNLIQK